jgi:hypothetical protein
MIPGISRNWRRTSTMIDCAVLPTARIARLLKKYASIAPMSAATNTPTSARLTDVRSGPPRFVWMRLTLSMYALKSRNAARDADAMA